jgi:hypothetical protein
MEHQLPVGDLMRKTPLALVFIFSLMVSAAYSAENNMRPGLWEMTTTSDLLWLVPEIPPDQMQNLKDLANQYGIDMPQIQMGEATSKVCIIREMADLKTPPDIYQDQLGCTAKNVTHTGNNYRLTFICASPQLKGNGIAEGTFTSSESFVGRTEFDGLVQGNPVNEHADTSGRWVSSSCGTVKSQ